MKRLIFTLCLMVPGLAFGQSAVTVTATDSVSGARVRDVGDATNKSIRTTCVTGCSAAGSKTNDAAAPAADLVPVVGAIASSATQAYTAGRLVLPRVNLFGATPIFLTDPTTGAALTASTDVTEDVAETSGVTGPAVMSVRRDTAASSAGLTGEYATFNTDALGRLWVNCGTGCSGGTQYAEDAVHTTGDTGTLALALRQDVAASSAGTNGDNTTMNTDALGRLWVRTGDPCGDHARITSAAISVSTAATNEIVALAAGETIYVCAYKWVTTGANSLKWVRGTGASCATGLTDIEGAQPFAANGGVAESGGGSALFAVTSANALCLTASAATAVGGRVSYVRTAAP